jgi:hypothetical protein
MKNTEKHFENIVTNVFKQLKDLKWIWIFFGNDIFLTNFWFKP